MKTNFYLKLSHEYTNVSICNKTPKPPGFDNTILLKNRAFLNYIYNFYICYQIFIKL